MRCPMAKAKKSMLDVMGKMINEDAVPFIYRPTPHIPRNTQKALIVDRIGRRWRNRVLQCIQKHRLCELLFLRQA